MCPQAHLSEEVHLPQQVAEHGVDVVHLLEHRKGQTQSSQLVHHVDKNVGAARGQRTDGACGCGWGLTVNQTHVKIHITQELLCSET